MASESNQQQYYNNNTKMTIEPETLEYLMSLRLLPMSGDDVDDYHGDNKYIQNCNSVSELRRMHRFLTQSRTDLIASVSKRLSALEGHEMSHSTTQNSSMQQQHHQQQCQTESPPQDLQNHAPAELTPSPTNRQEEMRRKEKFLMFAKVLLKYVEHKNKQMHTEAKAIIKECVARNQQQESGYESVTAAMQSRLKELVGEHYWARASAHYFEHVRRHNQRKAERREGRQGREYSSRNGGGHNRVTASCA